MEQAIVVGRRRRRLRGEGHVAGVPDRPGIAARLFRRLADSDVNVDMIVQNVSDRGQTDISFTLPARRPRRTHGGAPARWPPRSAPPGVASDDGIGRVSLVGAGMKSNPGVAATVFETLAEHEHQHRDDLDLGHPHQLRRSPRTTSTGRRSRCTPRSHARTPATGAIRSTGRR